ncbi:MAG: cupin domain-containing protein [Candidatus Omnitrophota bacterium]|nr:MAG: cupin domain-containing protein [Candidatus Omnitrophota bacterium]
MQKLKPSVTPIEGNERFQRLLAGIPFTAGMKSGCVTLKPQESIGEHITDAKEEAIIVLEGMAEVYIEGRPFFTAQAKSLVYIPPETTHDIKNIGNAILRYVYVTIPLVL